MRPVGVPAPPRRERAPEGVCPRSAGDATKGGLPYRRSCREGGLPFRRKGHYHRDATPEGTRRKGAIFLDGRGDRLKAVDPALEALDFVFKKVGDRTKIFHAELLDDFWMARVGLPEVWS